MLWCATDLFNIFSLVYNRFVQHFLFGVQHICSPLSLCQVLFTGKAAALGIKHGGPAPHKWAELPITKSPKIVQVATGHDSAHALMVADDGSVFFVGMAKRGEDGDSGAGKAVDWI